MFIFAQNLYASYLFLRKNFYVKCLCKLFIFTQKNYEKCLSLRKNNWLSPKFVNFKLDDRSAENKHNTTYNEFNKNNEPSKSNKSNTNKLKQISLTVKKREKNTNCIKKLIRKNKYFGSYLFIFITS